MNKIERSVLMAEKIEGVRLKVTMNYWGGAKVDISLLLVNIVLSVSRDQALEMGKTEWKVKKSYWVNEWMIDLIEELCNGAKALKLFAFVWLPEAGLISHWLNCLSC